MHVTLKAVVTFCMFLQLFGCRLNNVFGRAEQVKADLSFGTRTRMSYQVSN